MAIEIKVDNLKNIMASIKKLTETDVLVGIPQNETERMDGDPADNALIGYVMEYGSPAQNIPARPTLIPGVESVKDQIAKRFEKAGKAALDNNPKEMRAQMESAGIEASLAVKKMINSNVPPELAESTLAARARRGVSRTNTLVDTGQFRNAITYVLRKR